MGGSLETTKPITSFIDSLKDDVMQFLGTGDISFSDADKALAFIRNKAYGATGKLNPTDEAAIKNVIGGFLRESMQDDVAKQIPKEIFNNYMTQKDLYRAAASLLPSAERGAAQVAANRMFGPMTAAKAIIGHQAVGIPGLVAGAAEDLLVKEGIAPLAKATAQKGLATLEKKALATGEAGANLMRKFTTELTGKDPATYLNWAQRLKGSNTDAGRKLGNVLEHMSKQDNIGRNATMFTILQNKTYRDLLSGVSEGLADMLPDSSE